MHSESLDSHVTPLMMDFFISGTLQRRYKSLGPVYIQGRPDTAHQMQISNSATITQVRDRGVFGQQFDPLVFASF